MSTAWLAPAGRTVRPLALVVCVAVAPAAFAQPSIDHPGIECIAPGKYAVILSGIRPDFEVRTAKVYFRSSLYPDFYYVEMTYEDGRFKGILPRPSPETTQIIYYLEAIDGVFNGTRSIEWDPLVEECDDDPAVAYFTTDEAGIVIGATTSGQSAIPPGFSAVGIIGTIASTGLASGIGGGVGAGTAAAVGAVAAGAAGAVVAVSGPSEEPTSTIVAAVTTSTPTTNVPPTPDPGPTTTIGPTNTVPASTTVAGGSTTTVAGSTTTSTGGSSTSTTSSTTSIVTTTSTIATTTIPLPPLNAGCFTVQVLGECRARVDATCVNTPVDRYDWVLDVDNQWQTVTVSNGSAIEVHDWSSSCGENSKSIKFRLTVHRGADSDTATKSLTIPGEDDLKTLPDSSAVRARFETFLDVTGSARARVVVNGTSTKVIESGVLSVIDAKGIPGENTVSATWMHGRAEPGVWRFVFGAETGLVDGSLRIERGNVVSVSARSVVFRVDGRPGETVQFTYELRP